MPLDSTPNYPASLDSLPDPTEATYTDDDGYELDLLIKKLNAIVEILEARVGVGASNGTPTAGTLLGGDGAGTSSWRKLATADIETGGVIAKRQLDYNASTDLLSAAAIGTSYSDINSDQSFTVDDANSVVGIFIRGAVLVSHSTTSEVGTAIYVDSTTRYKIGGGFTAVNNQFLASIGGDVFITGLSAGSHNVRAQIVATPAATGYLRASTFPNYEHLGIQVVEFKR